MPTSFPHKEIPFLLHKTVTILNGFTYLFPFCSLGQHKPHPYQKPSWGKQPINWQQIIHEQLI